MQNVSIFFYTNNLVPPLILDETLRSAICHAETHNCELIITSHFPLTENPIYIPLVSNPVYKNDFDASKNEFYKSKIYDYIVKDLNIKTQFKNYVVGKLAYSYESIFKQILFSLEQASNDNIVLMEHDCLYPKGYIDAVQKCLIHYRYNFSYCSFASCFLNELGFFNISFKKFLLSSCSGKKDLFKKIFSSKLKLIKEDKPYKFEPLLDIEPGCKNEFKNDVIVKKHLCMDKFLDGPILDIRHQLNSSPNIMTREGDYFQEHEYWGSSEKYINMIKSIKVDPSKQNQWSYGTARQNY